MLRRSVSCLTAVTSTCVPHNFVYASDLAFYAPRFQPKTHLNAMGITEIKEAQALLQSAAETRGSIEDPLASVGSDGEMDSKIDSERKAKLVFSTTPRWSTTTNDVLLLDPVKRAECAKQREKGLLSLERGIEILESLGGVHKPANAAIPNLLRPLYATRFELVNGVEHLPRPAYGKHMHVQKSILTQAAKLLFYNDTWEKSDVNQLDTTFVILAHFVKAFCALHTEPFNTPLPAATAKAASSSSSPSSSSASAQSTTASSPSSALKSMRVKSGGSKSASAPAATAPNNHPAGAAAAPAASGSAHSKALPKDWTLCVGGADAPADILTLPMVMARLEELMRLVEKAVTTHGATHPELRWYGPKLLLLRAILRIPLDGHLLYAQKDVDKAAKTVFEWTQRDNKLLDGLKARLHQPELGLFLLAQAEMSARIFNWAMVQPGEVDAAVSRLFEDAAEFYSAPFNTALDADGIMAKEKLPEREFEVQAYATCMRSYSTFLLNAPRPKATSTRDSPVFLPHQLFTQNPLLTVATSSDMIFTDIQDRAKLSVEFCRKQTGTVLDRALTLNRGLYPDDFRQNAQAAWTLLSMACMYADTRDYLYATGLFETAKKAFVEQYGETSIEIALLHRLRYEFLAGVGSEEEAKTASHEVVHILKALDALPRL